MIAAAAGNLPLPGQIDAGDTAWMLAATALVLMMTPALGLFYAGLVRAKNTLNTFMMCVGALGVVTVTWAVIGYSLAFDKGNGFVGGLHYVFLQGVTLGPRAGLHIPHLLFFAFEATFCIVTAALVSGAVVERMRFGPFLIFMGIWSVVVYAVLAHWVFGGGGSPTTGRSTSRAACRSRWRRASRPSRRPGSSARGTTTAGRRCSPTTRSTC